MKYVNEPIDIANMLYKMGRMDFRRGATEGQITSFEKKYNIMLPSAFKKWLLYTDGGDFFLPAGVQLYGVATKPIIDINDNDRPCEKYIVIGRLCNGDPILFEKGKDEISIYNHEAGRIEKDEIFVDCISFLNNIPDILGFGG